MIGSMPSDPKDIRIKALETELAEANHEVEALRAQCNSWREKFNEATGAGGTGPRRIPPEHECPQETKCGHGNLLGVDAGVRCEELCRNPYCQHPCYAHAQNCLVQKRVSQQNPKLRQSCGCVSIVIQPELNKKAPTI